MTIFGPKQSRNDINVYHNPLIDDFRLFWDEGVEFFDAFFHMRAILFFTINDFPA